MNGEINLKKFLHIMKKRILTIVTTVLSVSILTSIISIYYMKPTYEVTENILIGKLANNKSTYGDSQELSMLLASSIDFIKSPIVLNSVKEELNINDEELEKKIAVQNNQNSQIVNIVVRDNNMEVAKELANTIATTSVNKMSELFGVQDIKLLSDINGEPSVKEVGSLPLKIAISIAVGFLLGVGLAMFREYWDDSIKDVNEIENILGLPVLGEINLKNKRGKSQNYKGTTQQDQVLKRSNGGQISV
ncbi:YveK family protein [Neobacillus cucumis]|uniref:YveK family protein n=1 Tax=Neobacillus cucumis TaxID=1740721 RepID=UPI00285315DF|nr:Wzz/FepE/Etk N-terminal domain-containing protein [Neobacillus cucumis]MDR4949082.1 Wzz/FepE/Etk N-terminal domain-containing protein [Neobacillus cucumis]